MFSSVLRKVKTLILNKYVASTLRHALTILSGYLIAAGVSEDVASGLATQLGDITVNALPGLLALLLSYFDKAKTVQK